MAAVGVIGSGTWGTALAILLEGNGHQVDLWSAIPEEAKMLRETRRHPNLDQAVIPDGIRVTDNLKESMESKDLLVMAVPSVYVRQTAAKMRPFLRPGQIVTNVAKGIEEASLLPLSQVIEAELPDAQVTVLSGPSHAEEVSRGLRPPACRASRRQPAEYVQSLFMNEFFRVYTSPMCLGLSWAEH